MPAAETALIAGAAFLGNEALTLLRDAAKSYVKKRIEKAFEGIEKKLGKDEHTAFQVAAEDAMTHGFGAVPTERELPIAGGSVWPLVAINFRKGAQERAFVDDRLREILNAKSLDRLVQLQEQLLGVRVRVRQSQYVETMLATYAQVRLANVAPSYTEDPGVLIVTDIFEPQHIRENPPPIELTKDEFESLCRSGNIDQNDDEAVLALLDEKGHGKDATKRIRFQRSSYTEQPARPVLDLISEPEQRLIVITGEPGSGKSTLLSYLLLGVLQPPLDREDPTRVLKWVSSFTGKKEHFPLLIELRDYYFTCQREAEVNSFLDYIGLLGESRGWGIDAKWLDDRLRTGSSLVMFDGLDEVFDKRDRDRIMREIAGFSRDYSRARVIVTSRPHGYHEDILRPAGFAHFRLQDLDGEQKQRFTTAWFNRVFPKSPNDAKARTERVRESIERSPSIRWLAGNPLLLTIMCLIAREKELPRERARFYEQCFDVLAHQWGRQSPPRDRRTCVPDHRR